MIKLVHTFLKQKIRKKTTPIEPNVHDAVVIMVFFLQKLQFYIWRPSHVINAFFCTANCACVSKTAASHIRRSRPNPTYFWLIRFVNVRISQLVSLIYITIYLYSISREHPHVYDVGTIFIKRLITNDFYDPFY